MTKDAAGTAIATTGPTGVTKEPAKPADQVRRALELLKPQMAAALPRHLTPERLVRVAMTAIQNTPKLLECDRTSLFAAVMTCAQLGLEPDGVLGQAYLVPFAGKVQFIPGYKGLIALARNSGEVDSINAHEVCRNDRFEYAFGLNERLDHVPAAGERGPVTHFYAVAKFKGGGHHFDVLTVAEVERIRDGSSGYKTALKYAKQGQEPQSPWVQNYVEMGKKTAVRRIAKFLPMNVQKAAAIADMYDAGRHARLNTFGDLEVETPAGGDVIDAPAVEEGASALDQFAGVTPAAAQSPAQEPAAPADPSGGPVLITPARAAELRAMAEKNGWDAEEVCADLSGSGLESTPAGFEASVLMVISKPAKTRKA